MKHSLLAAVYVIPAEACGLIGIYARPQLKHISVHQIINHPETVMYAMPFHAMLQVEADGHDN